MPYPDLAPLIARRSHLPTQGTTLYRALHTSETEGVFALDVAGEVGILSLYRELAQAEEQRLAQSCVQSAAAAGWPLSSLYLKRRPQEARHLANVARTELSPPSPIWGPPQDEVVALEQGVPYVIRPAADLSIGLFSDARPARSWVREQTAARVLNTFAYTCGFGLNATLGGAEQVKNVDLSRKVLAWGQQNYALSGLKAPDTDFLYGDVFDWLRRLHARGDLFDLVILDPPGFARSKRGTWRAEKDYGTLAAAAAGVTAPGGRLLALLNHAGVPSAGFQKQLAAALAPRHGQLVERFGAGEDHPQATHLKVQVWQLDAGAKGVR